MIMDKKYKRMKNMAGVNCGMYISYGLRRRNTDPRE